MHFHTLQCPERESLKCAMCKAYLCKIKIFNIARLS